MDDLVGRADYCHEHGLFDAVEAGKYVTYADLAAEIRSLREQVAQDRARIAELDSRATAAEAWEEVLKERLEQAAHNLEVGAQLYECSGLEKAGKLARQVLKGSNVTRTRNRHENDT